MMKSVVRNLFAAASIFIFNANGISAASQNIVVNPGFENDFKGWSNIQTDDKTYNFKTAIDNGIFHAGKKSASFEYLAGPDDGYCWISQTLAVKKGRSYRLSFYARAENATMTQSINLKWSCYKTYQPYEFECGKEWRKYEFYFLAPGTSLGLSVPFIGKGKIWFDDLELVESPLPKDMQIKNGIVFSYEPRRKNQEDASITFTPEEKQRGCLAYKRGNPGEVYSDSIPKRDEITDELTLAATPGEYEPVWFSVYAINDLKSVKVAVPQSLKNEKGENISLDNIDLRTVRCWEQRKCWRSTTYYSIPELLEKKDFVDIDKNKSQSFWLTIKVPEDAAPGKYESLITVTTEDQKEFNLKLKLTVLPFKLKNPKDKYWVMYADDLGYDKMPAEKIKAELADMKEHGINSVFYYPPAFNDCKFEKRGDKLVFSSEKLAQIQAMRKELGLKGPLIMNWGEMLERMVWPLTGIKAKYLLARADNPEVRQLIIKAFHALDSFMKTTGGNDYSSWYYMGTDEPGAFKERRPNALFEYKLASEAGIKSLVNMNESEFAETIAPYVTGFDWSGGPRSETSNMNRKNYRAEYWWYGSGCYTGQEGGLVPNRYLCGLLYKKSGAKGQISWIYHRLGPSGDPYDDFDGNAFWEPKDALIVYPAADGTMIPTLQWEGIREGIDDYKYLYTLETLIDEAKKSGNSATQKAADDIEGEKIKIMESLPWAKEHKSIDNAKLGETRNKIISLTIRLLAELKQER